MISITMPSRSKGNLSSKISSFIESIISHTTDEEKKLVEIILKFDDDDEVPECIANNKYPFNIKYVQYARGSGRYEAHNTLNYLNTLIDRKTLFIFNPSDDFIITKSFVTEILSQDSNYRILGGATGVSSCCVKGGCPCPTLPDPLTIPLGANHRNKHEWGHCIAAYAPIYGIDILKSVSYNQGLFSSTDAYFIAIALALYRIYGVNVWRDMKTFYYRNEYGGPGCENAEYLRNLKNYNKLDFQQFPRDYNPVIWDIIESHAKNIFLNMKQDGQV